MTRSRLVPVLLSALLLLVGANLGAFAATGEPLLLAKGNTAAKTTKLKTTGKGPALSLKSKAGVPALAVSGPAKISNLNADQLDGLDAAALTTKTYVYSLSGITPNNQFIYFDLPGLSPGHYVVTYSIGMNYPSSTSSLRGYFVRTAGAADHGIHLAGEVDPNGGVGIISASGYLDTTATTYRFWLQNTAGGITVPADDGLHTYPAQLAFTRIDETTVAGLTGTATNTPTPRSAK